MKVSDLTKEEAVIRELALIKVRCRPEQRREILDLVEIFRAQAVDVTQNGIVVQITAQPETVDGLLDNLRSYGIREMVRTGRIAIARGAKSGRRLRISSSPSACGRIERRSAGGSVAVIASRVGTIAEPNGPRRAVRVARRIEA